MKFTTLSLRIDVARKLKAAKIKGESYSETIERLLENQPAMTVGEFLDSLKPLEGRGVFTREERERLTERHLPQRSPRRKKRRAAA